ncbi:uncharacterized protein LOC130912777 isoform X2 [Corythoichthys intestinalis]|uniref:uncharacterized protein LOC130912777 isoform X2 n=1 Tax=Corythoichthys intestinalis TaxID=161448 RepID=UPI0025A5EF07|nr:uncharacterized protein LOC130912777 isoform X2 [Corythoichthys intestinalis]
MPCTSGLFQDRRFFRLVPGIPACSQHLCRLWKRMDHLSANKNEEWAGHTGWSAGPLFTSLSCPSPPHYGHSQVPDDSFPHAPASVSHGHVSPASLFAGTAFELPQLSVKPGLQPTVIQTQLAPPGAPPTCTQLPCVTFPCTSLPGVPPACVTSSSFQSQYRLSDAHSQTSSAPRESSQWIDSSLPAALNDSDHPDENAVAPTPMVTKRSVLLHQRSLLLKQLSELDKLLESLPKEESDVCEESPDSAAQMFADGGASSSAAAAAAAAATGYDGEGCRQVDEGKRAEERPAATAGPSGGESELQEKSLAESSDGASSKSIPSDDTDASDAPSDFGDHDTPRSDGSTPGRRASPRLKNPRLQSLRTEPREAEIEWSHLKIVKVKSLAKLSDEESSKSIPRDDTDTSSDFGDDDTPRSGGSPPGRRSSPRLKKLRSQSLRSEPREAETEWSRLKNVKVCAMKLGKKSSKRVSRRNYCLFCSKAVIKMYRHLQSRHGQKKEVAAALLLPKGSRERQKMWNRLINEGNFAHNKQVLESGEGQLAVRKRRRTTGRAHDFLHCLYCRGLFVKKNLTVHMKRCPERQKSRADGPRLGQERVETRCALEVAGDLGVGAGFRAVLSQMIYDDATRLIIDEPVLLRYGEDMLARNGAESKGQQITRQNLRQMARLVLEARKKTPLKKLEHFFLPDSFPHVVAAVNVLAGYDSAGRTYSAPSLAIKLGYSLQKVCRIVQERARERGDARLADSAKSFLVVYRKRWTEMISSGALSSLREIKRNSAAKAPDAEDVKKLSRHVEEVRRLAEEKLRARPSAETYGALARALLARIVLFNQRQSNEISALPLAALKSVKKPDPLENLDVFACELERNMCRVFSRMETRASCGRLVPVLLKPTFSSSLELLVDVRRTCGVPAQNPFLFGRPHALSAYRGSACLQAFVKECVAGRADTLTLRNIRRHYAATLPLVHLDPTEAELVLLYDKRMPRPNQNVCVELQDIGINPEELTSARLECGQSRPLAPWETGESFRGLSATSRKTSGGKGSAASSVGKHKWSGDEVSAVERHMMSFIRNHRLPQKQDCVRCLDAEPGALGTRSWKGVKDYVRNRITALKRQSKTTSYS